MNEFDVWRTCRTCLSRAAELIPLNSAYDVKGVFEEISANKTNGDLLMECANVEFNEGDGLPQNVCIECVSSLRAAFAYKQMCERSDVKLRHIFNNHLTSVRVKIERINETNDREVVRPLEVHWLDDTISEPFEKFSQKSESENGDDWSKQQDEEIDRNDATCNSLAADVETKEEQIIKMENFTADSDQTASNVLSEALKNAKCDNGSWICNDCNKPFRNRRTLKLHIRRQIHLNKHGHGSNSIRIQRQPILRLKPSQNADDGNEEDVKLLARAQCVDGRWLCEICKKTLADRTTLKLHIRVHLGINLKQCPNCPKSFAKQSFLDFHMKSHEIRNHSCQQCDMVFSTKQAMREHTIDVHKVEKPPRTFMCEICSKVFNRANTLNQHRITHTGEKKFACEICHKKVGTKASLHIHMRLHGDRADLYRFLCPHCGKKFTTGAHMAGHIRAEHTGERPYKCESCELAFHRYDNWAQHRLKHVDRYVCTICGKSLSSKARLVSHTRMHSGEKPYKCSICSHAFATWKSLKTHLSRHTDEDVPNKCNICGNLFGNEKQLEKHRRQFDHQLPANQMEQSLAIPEELNQDLSMS